MILTSLMALQILVSDMTNQERVFGNLSGATGVMRTTSAQPNQKGVFGLSMHGSFFSKDTFISDLKTSRSHLRLSGNYTVKWGIPIEFYGGFGFTYTERSSSGSSNTMTTLFENTELGYRMGFLTSGKTLFLGTFGHITALSGSQTQRNTSGVSSLKSGPPVSGTVGFSQTLNLAQGENKRPFRQHLNLAYRAPNSDIAGQSGAEFQRFGLNAINYHSLVYSVAAEMLLSKFTPFVEYSGEYAFPGTNSSPSLGDNRMQATLGTRWSPIEPFALLLGLDVGIAGPVEASSIQIPRNTPWDVWLAVNFQSDGLTARAPLDGGVQGSVLDDRTGLPIDGVKVTLVSESQLPQTTDLSGSFRFGKLPVGDYEMTFIKVGYEPVRRRVSVQGGQEAVLETRMRIIGPSYGSLTAQVLDQKTRQPIARAFVSISGIEQPVATDDQGRFKNEQIPEGKQTVNVEAPGYKSQSFPVEIPPNGQVQTDLLLSKAPPTMGTCSGVVKNPDGTPLTAVITHEADESISPSGTNPLTGEFKVSLPPGKHSLKVTAENYLPQMVECEVEAGQSTALGVTLEKPKEAVLIENKIILPDAIYFEFGSAEIKESSWGVLDQVAEILKTNPNFNQLNIDGHTDDVGSDAFNSRLSKRRAESVRTYLTRKGLDSSKLAARGFGESKPIATNLTPEGRAENRRVEFNVQAAE